MIEIRKVKKNLSKIRFVCITIIVIATMSLGIGYAQIVKELDITGNAIAIAEKSVIITNAEYVSDVGADITNTTVNYSKSILTSKIVLGNTLNSSITYKLKIINNGTSSTKFKDTIFTPGTGYDNQDIVFSISGIAIDDVLAPNEERDVTITFSYDPNLTQITNNVLNSVINFKFDTNDIIYQASSVSFDGNLDNIIDTGVNLYSAENVNRNFVIKFTVDSYDSSYDTASNIDNNNAPTIINSMKETASPFSGIVYRVYKNSNKSVYNFKVNDSHVSSYNPFYTLTAGKTVEIYRENGAIYYKEDSGIVYKVLTYDSSIDTFDIPLTIGGSINAVGEYYRPFIGTLSDVYIAFYEGNQVSDLYTHTETRTSNSYRLDGKILFDGTNYIDTGINVLSHENINKDFDLKITVEIPEYNTTQQATLFNIKDESQNNVWPGVAYRLIKGKNTEYELTARWPNQSTVSYTDYSTKPIEINISRVGGTIYYSYGGATPAVLISTPESALSNPINKNVTFGASLDGSGNPFRYFKGLVSNISLEIYDS